MDTTTLKPVLTCIDASAFCVALAWVAALAPWFAGALSGLWLAARLYNEVMAAVDRRRRTGGWF